MKDNLFEISMDNCYQWGKYGACMDFSLLDKNKFSRGGIMDNISIFQDVIYMKMEMNYC